MKLAKTLVIAGLSFFGSVAGSEADAHAQGGVSSCSQLQNPVYMAGTTAVLPVIRHFGAKLKQQVGITLLWNENSEGCSAENLMVNPASNGVRTVFSYYDEVDSTATNSKIIPTNCNGLLDQIPDLVINDTYWTSCVQSMKGISGGQPVPLSADLKEFLGPVQGLVPIVAHSYLYYNDIMAEELQDMYICGGQADILTFTVSSTIYDYGCTNSGVRALFGRTLGLASGLGNTTLCNDSNGFTAESIVIGQVAPTTTPDTTIGYTSTEFYDENRDRVRGLKVRGINQRLAYLPDTDLASTDKSNIREGRYTLQGSLKLVTKVDASRIPTNPLVKKIIDWMQDNPLSDPALALPFDINQIYAQRGVVPQCAMRVTKESDQLGFKHYRHPKPCHCSFEMLATGKTSEVCTTCTDSSTCAAGQMCSHGYCE
jgi:hypothetical protein